MYSIGYFLGKRIGGVMPVRDVRDMLAGGAQMRRVPLESAAHERAGALNFQGINVVPAV